MAELSLREKLQQLAQRVIPGKTINIGGVSTIKPGETTQTLQDRLGVGGITFKQAGEAVKQGTGAFVPSARPIPERTFGVDRPFPTGPFGTARPIPERTLPFTIGPGGQVVFQPTGIPPLPPGTQPITTQPQPLTITPQQLQPQPKPITQPTTGGIVTVEPGVKPIAPPITGQQPVSTGIAGGQPAIDLQKQIDETKARLKETQGQQKALQTIEAMGGKVVMPGEEKPAEPTGLEKYEERVRGAFEPVTKAITELIETRKTLPASTEEYSRLSEEVSRKIGVPELDIAIKNTLGKLSNIEVQMENAPEDIRNRAKDFLITERQVQRLTQAEMQPMTTLYNSLSRALRELTTTRETTRADREEVRREVSTILGLAEKDAERKEKALQVALQLAQLGFGVETGLAKTGFEAEAELAKEARKAPKIELEMEKTRAEIEKLRRPEITEGEKLLSPSEAETLGVPYGTTREQAAKMGITPGGEVGFTEQEKRKLETAGLLNSPREQQLDFLYGGDVQTQMLMQQLRSGQRTLDDMSPEELTTIYMNL